MSVDRVFSGSQLHVIYGRSFAIVTLKRNVFNPIESRYSTNNTLVLGAVEEFRVKIVLKFF